MSRGKTDWEGVTLIICVFVVLILTLGEPDLLTALIHNLMEGKA